MSIANQNQRLIAHLRIAPITSLEALNYLGIMRLGARVFELKRQGYNIVSQMVAVKNSRGEVKHVAKYRLIEEVRKAA